MKYYKKVQRGAQKCLSELGIDMKPLHVFTYYKTWREAWAYLRTKHGCSVVETHVYFVCEVPGVIQLQKSFN